MLCFCWQNGRRDFVSSSAAEAKEVPKRPDGQSKAAAESKGRLGVVKDKPFDEAHSLGDDSGDLSSEESVMTNESQPKMPVRSTAAPTAASAAMSMMQPAKAQG